MNWGDPNIFGVSCPPQVRFYCIVTLFGLGVKLTPPRQIIFIFEWLKLRICDLLSFTGNMRGTFYLILRVINIFFEFLKDFQSQNETPKTAKYLLFKFRKLKEKNSWCYGHKCLEGNISSSKVHLLAPFKFLPNFQKFENRIWKLVVFDQKIEFFVNNSKTIRLL